MLIGALGAFGFNLAFGLGAYLGFLGGGALLLGYLASVWTLNMYFQSYSALALIKVNSGDVSCHSKDGTHYVCAREGLTPGLLLPPIPGFPLESIILGIIVGTALVLLRIKRNRDPLFLAKV